MRHTVHADFALRVLTYLALAPDRRAKIGVIADSYRISRHHLAKVSQSLIKGGFVSAERGRGGGILLARDPAAITIGAIVRACEDDFALVECMGPARFCRINGVCNLRQLFSRALTAYFAVLDEMTLADAVKHPQSLLSVLNIQAMLPQMPKPAARVGGGSPGSSRSR